MRLAAVVEYDGARFQGWQIQAGTPTVQAAVEKALSSVANHDVRTTCAGRTDAGVHACAQVVHFDTQASRTPRSWTLGANVNLPDSITVHGVSEMPGDFHARFSATSRRYRYVVLNRWIRPALQRERVGWYRPRLDEERMRAAAQCLVGEHDFSSFRAVACQAKQPVRHLYEVTVLRDGDCVTVDMEANAFLHHMVRNIVGTLLEVGNGERPVEWMQQVLESRDREAAGVTAPAGGLYLLRVTYPERFTLPPACEILLPGGVYRHA